jgi:hypothetical protein
MNHTKICLLLSTLLAGPLPLFSLEKAHRDDLVKALIQVESNGNPKAVGDGGKAYGILQIHKIMVDEANRIGKTSFTHQDMFDPAKSQKVADIVLTHYDRHIRRTTGKEATAKQLAFIWNGGASSWKRVNSPIPDTKQANLERYWSKVAPKVSKR